MSFLIFVCCCYFTAPDRPDHYAKNSFLSFNVVIDGKLAAINPGWNDEFSSIDVNLSFMERFLAYFGIERAYAGEKDVKQTGPAPSMPKVIGNNAPKTTEGGGLFPQTWQSETVDDTVKQIQQNAQINICGLVLGGAKNIAEDRSNPSFSSILGGSGGWLITQTFFFGTNFDELKEGSNKIGDTAVAVKKIQMETLEKFIFGTTQNSNRNATQDISGDQTGDEIQALKDHIAMSNQQIASFSQVPGFSSNMTVFKVSQRASFYLIFLVLSCAITFHIYQRFIRVEDNPIIFISLLQKTIAITIMILFLPTLATTFIGISEKIKFAILDGPIKKLNEIQYKYDCGGGSGGYQGGEISRDLHPGFGENDDFPCGLLAGYRITSDASRPGHHAIDFKRTPGERGGYAPLPVGGVIEEIGEMTGCGTGMKIRDSNGEIHLFCHTALFAPPPPEFKKGNKIEAGTPIPLCDYLAYNKDDGTRKKVCGAGNGSHLHWDYKGKKYGGDEIEWYKQNNPDCTKTQISTNSRKHLLSSSNVLSNSNKGSSKKIPITPVISALSNQKAQGYLYCTPPAVCEGGNESNFLGNCPTRCITPVLTPTPDPIPDPNNPDPNNPDPDNPDPDNPDPDNPDPNNPDPDNPDPDNPDPNNPDPDNPDPDNPDPDNPDPDNPDPDNPDPNNPDPNNPDPGPDDGEEIVVQNLSIDDVISMLLNLRSSMTSLNALGNMDTTKTNYDVATGAISFVTGGFSDWVSEYLQRFIIYFFLKLVIALINAFVIIVDAFMGLTVCIMPFTLVLSLLPSFKENVDTSLRVFIMCLLLLPVSGIVLFLCVALLVIIPDAGLPTLVLYLSIIASILWNLPEMLKNMSASVDPNKLSQLAMLPYAFSSKTFQKLVLGR